MRLVDGAGGRRVLARAWMALTLCVTVPLTTFSAAVRRCRT